MSSQRRNEMKFAYSGPFASRKGFSRKLGTSFATPYRDAAGHVVPTMRYAASAERYTIQTATRPAVVQAIIISAFGRESK